MTTSLIMATTANHDAHCGRCGSLLYSVVRDGAFVHVAMGTLVDEPSIRPTAHIFVGSKAPWFEITDDLPQYQEHLMPSSSARSEKLSARSGNTCSPPGVYICSGEPGRKTDRPWAEPPGRWPD